MIVSSVQEEVLARQDAESKYTGMRFVYLFCPHGACNKKWYLAGSVVAQSLDARCQWSI